MDTTTTWPTAVEIHGLRRIFTPRGSEPVAAVAGVDLEVEKGEVVALLGPNGAGKTTLLDLLLGLGEPTAGTVRVFGRPPREAVTAGRVSAVLQTGGLLRDLTVRETVRLVASTFPRHAPVDEVMERAGLSRLAKRRVSKCSGGEQQRLRFALALLPDPDLLVLDEPTTGMDVTARRDFWAAMHEEAARGRTVVFATHYLAEAEDFAERIVMMARGRVVADATTSELRRYADERSVSARVAEPEPALERLRALPAVSEAGMVDGRLRVRTLDGDTVARLLLDELGGSDLLVESAGLEDAFVALTGAPLAAEPDETEPTATDETEGVSA